MQATWVRRNGTARLLVVFGGWAVGADPFRHLARDCDLLFLDDYRDLDWEPGGLEGYDDRVLLAWSFGVPAYAHWSVGRADPFTRKVAANGTVSPVDRRAGIPPVIYRATHDGLNADSYQDFLTRAWGAEQPRAEIDVAARRSELAAVEQRGAAREVSFDRIWISGKDGIFPPANMTRAWAGQAGAVRTLPDAPHVPFDRFKSVEALWA